MLIALAARSSPGRCRVSCLFMVEACLDTGRRLALLTGAEPVPWPFSHDVGLALPKSFDNVHDEGAQLLGIDRPLYHVRLDGTAEVTLR